MQESFCQPIIKMNNKYEIYYRRKSSLKAETSFATIIQNNFRNSNDSSKRFPT